MLGTSIFSFSYNFFYFQLQILFLETPSPIAQSVHTGLENRTSLVRSMALPTFFPRIDDSHCNRIHSFLTAVHCFENGKQPMAWQEYCVECWLKELQESMDRHTGHCDITEMLLKMVLFNVICFLSHVSFVM